MPEEFRIRAHQEMWPWMGWTYFLEKRVQRHFWIWEWPDWNIEAVTKLFEVAQDWRTLYGVRITSEARPMDRWVSPWWKRIEQFVEVLLVVTLLVVAFLVVLWMLNACLGFFGCTAQ